MRPDAAGTRGNKNTTKPAKRGGGTGNRRCGGGGGTGREGAGEARNPNAGPNEERTPDSGPGRNARAGRTQNLTRVSGQGQGEGAGSALGEGVIVTLDGSKAERGAPGSGSAAALCKE